MQCAEPEQGKKATFRPAAQEYGNNIQIHLSTPLVKMIHPTHPEKEPLDPDIEAISHSVIVDGAEHIVSYDGISQYNKNGTGASACGLAALNFARIVFSMERSGLRDTTLLQGVLTRACAEETTAICSLWSGNLHLEVDDICRVPLFEKRLNLKTTTYGRPGVSEFKSLLTKLDNLNSSAVVIITCPPEIIACLKLQLATRNVFIIFDSHPRPSYPNGAGMIVSTSIEGTARRLTELLPTVDLPDNFLQWQAQLLANYSGHVFVSHGVETSAPTLWQAVLESSLAQLSTQAENAELRSQNDFLKAERQLLESKFKKAEARSREQERLIRQLQQQEREKEQEQERQLQQREREGLLLQEQERERERLLQLLQEKEQEQEQLLLLLQEQLQEQEWQQRQQQQQQQQFRSSSGSQKYVDHSVAPPTQFLSLMSQSSTPSSSNVSTSPSDRDNSIFEAMQLQNAFDKEDRVLSAQLAELARSVQRLFECGICMEEMPDDLIARPDPCGHTFCRECLRGHVTARLDEHRFPILCPTCTAGKGEGKEAAGEVSQSLALNLGLTDEQYSIWTEMELVSFSVPLSCRKCERTMFVARDEHEEAKIITCPLPDCNHAWCKQCQQSIDVNGPKHSCDGSSELDHLMKQEGWKYCPTCKAPIQKISGCNHMSCMTPACNTHFCYICGDLIVKSALGQGIKEATSAHFQTKCALFEVPE